MPVSQAADGYAGGVPPDRGARDWPIELSAHSVGVTAEDMKYGGKGETW
jgi:hypothetical protein